MNPASLHWPRKAEDVTRWGVAERSAEERMEKRKTGERIVGDDRARLTELYVRHYEDGHSIRAIAEASGRSYGFVHRILAEAGVQLRKRGGDTKRRES